MRRHGSRPPSRPGSPPPSRHGSPPPSRPEPPASARASRAAEESGKREGVAWRGRSASLDQPRPGRPASASAGVGGGGAVGLQRAGKHRQNVVDELALGERLPGRIERVVPALRLADGADQARSEEHTYEIQVLMSITNAV